jgi:uncharacterized membrane protein
MDSSIWEAYFSSVRLHLVLNHFPIVGLSIGLVTLLIATLFKQRPVIGAALWIIGISAALTYPTVRTGHQSEGKLYDQIDRKGEEWLTIHAERAERIEIACYVLAGLSLAGYVLRKLRPKLENVVSWLILPLTLASLIGLFWVADAGGKVRHPEIRQSPSPR